MKKIYAFMVAAIALTAVACNNEAIDEVVGGENIANGDYITTLTVSLDNTRTELADGGKTTWCEGDEISLNGSVFELTDAATGQFSLKEGQDAVAKGLSEYTVLYPANTTAIPVTQEATAGSFAHGAALLKTVVTSDAALEGLKLEHAHALLKFTVAGDATSVSVLGYTLEGTITAGETYYLAVPAATYAEFAATVDGTVVKSTTNVTLTNGQILNLKTLPVKSNWGLAGTHNEWSAGDSTTMLYDGTYHVATNIAGGVAFQFVYNKTWDVQRGFVWQGTATANDWNLVGGKSNIELPTEADAYDIYFSSDKGVFNVVPAGGKITDYAPQGKVIYLDSGVWEAGNAYFEAWVWGSTQADAWYHFTRVGESMNTYCMVVPSDATSMKVLRKGPNEHSSNNWDSWNDSGDQDISSKNMLVVKGWSSFEMQTK